MPDVKELVALRNGAARTGELLSLGVSRRQLQAALAKGSIDRPARGVVALPDADPLLVRCLTTNSLLTCVSAAECHGLWVLHEPEKVHLLRSDGRLVSDRAVVHRQSWVAADLGSRLASLADVVLHALSCLPELEALVIAESAVQKGLSKDYLLAQLPGRRNGRARAVLDLIEPGADSLVETLARTHLRRAGLRVRSQVEIGGVGWVDHLIEECVILETDGKEHQKPASRYKDYARDAHAQTLRLAVVRVGYGDLVHHPDQMVERVKAVVAARLSMGRLPVL
ncbi:type IV toxin-antitoxin system AbiEi family antitoxin domain-containing protein [Sinomonas sp. P10A9]|uniref:Type IV toxin-antitoxin system AbiEi family antitoxin domain-containing protein n=1 Tax=Sinomonas puerhi TaxID=3238584 RepID=A0AB39L1F0_9MICC